MGIKFAVPFSEFDLSGFNRKSSALEKKPAAKSLTPATQARILSELARTWIDLGRVPDARKASEKAVAMQPELPEAKVAQAWILYARGEYEAALGEFTIPLLDQRPVGGAGAEVGEREVAFEPGDRAVEQPPVVVEDRAMAGEQPFDVAGGDPLERRDEGGDIAAVVGVDRAHATVAIDVVAAE
jgi:tetratricopeptide (TPR) repeat protein